VNSYIKNLVAKGYITVRNIPSKRYAYYLTPKGFAEKSRLAYDLLADYTRIYREARNNFKQLFMQLEQEGIKRIVFTGADEVAEIAYITLQETSFDIVAVLDDDKNRGKFFGREIKQLDVVRELTYDAIIITSFVHRERYCEQLLKLGVRNDVIRRIF
jgi:hypothetical protein